MGLLSGQFFWVTNTLTPTMLGLHLAIEAAIEKQLHEMAERMEMYMKANAPWEDRSGDARSGLTAQAERINGQPGIVLYHTVDYGIWLEIRWGGEYAIIQPTIEHFQGEIMSGITFRSILAEGIEEDLGGEEVDEVVDF